MAWRNYDIKEAMERANNGTATIAIGEDRVMIVPANDAVDNELVSSGDNDLILNITPETSALEVSSLRFYSYSNGGTGGGAGDGGAGDGGAGDGGAGNGGTGGGNSGSGTGGDSGGQGLLTTPIQFVESLILLEVGEEMDAPQYLTTIDDITSYQLRWTSSNENVATVDLYSGHICAEGVGLATITLSIDNTTISATYNIRVNPITYGYPTDSRTISAYGGYSVDHPGIDIPGDSETPVYAFADGVVKYIQYVSTNWNPNSPAGQAILTSRESMGNAVEINHYNPNPTLSSGQYARSIYMHLSSICVDIEQSVHKGDIIGYIGNTGRSSAPHLHFALSTGDLERMNPDVFIDRSLDEDGNVIDDGYIIKDDLPNKDAVNKFLPNYHT